MNRPVKRATLSNPPSVEEPASGSPPPCNAESSSKAARALKDTEVQQHADVDHRRTDGSSDAEVYCTKPDEVLVRRIGPRNLFICVSILFWGTMFVNHNYSQSRHHESSLDTLKLLPCNPSKRVLAVCAHRGDAAELLSASPSSSSSSEKYSLQDRMTVLWRTGITCFDFDVIQLADNHLVVGHPTELVQLAVQSRTRGTSSTGVKITPESLQNLKLTDLRAAGLDADSVPLLITVVRHFAHLRRSRPISVGNININSSSGGGSSSATPQVRKVSLGQAAAEQNLQYVPLLSLELKGPAAASSEAWNAVTATVTAAGIADAVVLWLRHQPTGSSSGSGNNAIGNRNMSAVVQWAQSIKKGRSSSSGGDGSSSSSSSSSSNAGSGVGTPIGPSATDGPLIGLIVPDNIMSPGKLLSTSSSSRATEIRAIDGTAAAAAAAAATAVIHAAAGLPYSGSSSSVHVTAGNNNSSSNSMQAGNRRNSSAPAALAPFDMLAPSIRLPAAVLAQLLTWKPSFSWVVDDDEAMQRAAWLGVHMGVSNVPVHLAAFSAQAGSSVCL